MTRSLSAASRSRIAAATKARDEARAKARATTAAKAAAAKQKTTRTARRAASAEARSLAALPVPQRFYKGATPKRQGFHVTKRTATRSAFVAGRRRRKA